MATTMQAGDLGVLTLGERLAIMRRRRGLTLRELAARSGVDISSLSRYERDEREPASSRLLILARVLGTTPNDLLGYADRANPG